MKAIEILQNIKENGGFDNFRNWTRKEKKQWVKANFTCSDYVADKVSYSI